MQIQQLVLGAGNVHLGGQRGPSGSFGDVLAQALAPPGNPPPPHGTKSNASEELKTQEPNAQSKKPDPASETPAALLAMMPNPKVADGTQVKPEVEADDTNCVSYVTGTQPLGTESIADALGIENVQTLQSPTAELPTLNAEIQTHTAAQTAESNPAAQDVVAPQAEAKPQAKSDAKPATSKEALGKKSGQMRTAHPEQGKAPETAFSGQNSIDTIPNATAKNALEKGQTDQQTADNLETEEKASSTDSIEAAPTVQIHQEVGKPQIAEKAATTDTTGQNDRQSNQNQHAQDQRDKLAIARSKGIKIEMNPFDLGPMSVTISQEGDSVQAQFQVHNAAAHQAIAASQATLKQSLSDQGLNMSSFQVSTGLDDSAPKQNAQDQTRQQSQNMAFQKQTLNPTNTIARQVKSGRGLDLWI